MRPTSVVSCPRTAQLERVPTLQTPLPSARRIDASWSEYIVCRNSPPIDQFWLIANSTPAPITPPQATPLALAVIPVGTPKLAEEVLLSNSMPVCLMSAQAAPPVA